MAYLTHLIILVLRNITMTKIPTSLITLSTLPLKLEHKYHISLALKKQANKNTLILPLQLEQFGAHNTKTY
jgi:hypothetical protein